MNVPQNIADIRNAIQTYEGKTITSVTPIFFQFSTNADFSTYIPASTTFFYGTFGYSLTIFNAVNSYSYNCLNRTGITIFTLSGANSPTTPIVGSINNIYINQFTAFPVAINVGIACFCSGYKFSYV